MVYKMNLKGNHLTITIQPENYFVKPNLIIKNNIDIAESLISITLDINTLVLILD